MLILEDKRKYLELFAEHSIMAKAKNIIDFDSHASDIWNEIEGEDAIYVSVISKDLGKYMGNIVLRNLSSVTPEIRDRIDILRKYQRQGIVYEALRLFMKQVAHIGPINCFLVRIYSDNKPSLGLLCELGVIDIEEFWHIQKVKEKLDK